MDEDQVEIEEADRRAKTAKASLRSRLHELERRYEAAKEKFDLRAHIARRPRVAVGIAFGIGAVLGLRGRAKASKLDGERTIRGTIVAALGAFAINAIRDLAVRQGTEIAKGWWADRTERDASRDPAVEAFLEH